MNRNSVSLFLFPPTQRSHTVSPGVFSFCVVGRTEEKREREQETVWAPGAVRRRIAVLLPLNPKGQPGRCVLQQPAG